MGELKLYSAPRLSLLVDVHELEQLAIARIQHGQISIAADRIDVSAA